MTKGEGMALAVIGVLLMLGGVSLAFETQDVKWLALFLGSVFAFVIAYCVVFDVQIES